eukprot:363769-Chlamydomonas_euryale.AAC.3
MGNSAWERHTSQGITVIAALAPAPARSGPVACPLTIDPHAISCGPAASRSSWRNEGLQRGEASENQGMPRCASNAHVQDAALPRQGGQLKTHADGLPCSQAFLVQGFALRAHLRHASHKGLSWLKSMPR